MLSTTDRQNFLLAYVHGLRGIAAEQAADAAGVRAMRRRAFYTGAHLFVDDKKVRPASGSHDMGQYNEAR